MRNCYLNNSKYKGKEVINLNISEYARLLNCSWSTAKKRLEGVTKTERQKNHQF